MPNPEVLRKANTAATIYLEMRGFTILEQNVRRPRVDISIVATKAGKLYFVDVHYRPEANEAADIVGISPLKVQQMKRIDEIWREETKWTGVSEFSQVEIVGPEYLVMNFTESAF